MPAGALALAAWVVRWRDRGRSLYSWDSGLLAGGIERFDFLAARPHAPFYPLTIAAGKAMGLFGLAPVDALVLLAVAASGVMAAGTFLVARRLMGQVAAVGAGLLVVLSPLAHFNGIAPLSYALEGAASVAVAGVAWWCRDRPTPRRAMVLGVVAALAVGLRPSSAVFFAPLLLWAVWRDRRAIGACVVGGATATLAWFIPMLVAGGGLGAFRRTNAYQTEELVLHAPFWSHGISGIQERAGVLAGHLGPEGPWLAAVLLVGVVTALAWQARARTWSFLGAWALPALGFYIFVYAGWPVRPSGYLMVFVPPMAIAAAAALETAWQGIRSQAPPAPALRTAQAIIVVVALIPLTWPGTWDEAAAPMRESEAWSQSWAALPATYDAADTALLTGYGWSWARAEHPDYLAFVVQSYLQDGATRVQVTTSQHGEDATGYYANIFDGDDPRHPIPDHIRRIVLLEGHPIGGAPDLVKPGLLHEETLANGHVVRVLDPEGLPSIEAAFIWTDPSGREVQAP